MLNKEGFFLNQGKDQPPIKKEKHVWIKRIIGPSKKLKSEDPILHIKPKENEENSEETSDTEDKGWKKLEIKD